jgi:8-oxo-dGTP diphosphatase
MLITEPEGWISVAVGITRNPVGQLLVGQRPSSKAFSGKWEFPGGKLEPGENILKALMREFREELGLEIIRAEPVFVVRHRYPDRSVELNVWRVTESRGEATGREGQVVRWVAPQELSGLDFLEGNQAIVERVICELGNWS